VSYRNVLKARFPCGETLAAGGVWNSFQADIYVSSSLWEGLPIAVLEAMAFRLPVVATNVIGNREAVADRETGFLVPPRDPGALSKAILTLVQDRNLRKQMGNRGRIRVETMFHPDRFIREHEEFYMDILGRDH